MKKSSFRSISGVSDTVGFIQALGAKGWVSANGSPVDNNTPAQNGFHYLDLVLKDVWKKEANVWSLVGNIQGDASWAREWAEGDVDTLVSEEAGGDGESEYSAKHYSYKAEESFTATTAVAAEVVSNASTVQSNLDSTNTAVSQTTTLYEATVILAEQTEDDAVATGDDRAAVAIDRTAVETALSDTQTAQSAAEAAASGAATSQSNASGFSSSASISENNCSIAVSQAQAWRDSAESYANAAALSAASLDTSTLPIRIGYRESQIPPVDEHFWKIGNVSGDDDNGPCVVKVYVSDDEALTTYTLLISAASTYPPSSGEAILSVTKDGPGSHLTFYTKNKEVWFTSDAFNISWSLIKMSGDNFTPDLDDTLEVDPTGLLTDEVTVKGTTATGHTKAGNMQVPNDPSDRTYTVIQNTITEDTWETIGPTGSGADLEWSSLDDVPIGTAAMLLLQVKLQAVNSGTSSCRLSVYTGHSSLTGSIPSYNAQAELQHDGNSTGSLIYQTFNVRVPLDSDGVFAIGWDKYNTSSNVIQLTYAGFLTDD